MHEDVLDEIEKNARTERQRVRKQEVERGEEGITKKRTHAFTRHSHSQQLHRQKKHHHSNAVIFLPPFAL